MALRSYHHLVTAYCALCTLGGEGEFALHVLMHAPRHADTARFGEALQPCRYVAAGGRNLLSHWRATIHISSTLRTVHF
jgi:hypothetical protein